MQKDYYVANAVAKVFGDCEVKVEHVRNYVHKDDVLMETNPDERITIIYVDLPHWVSQRIRATSIRIMRYEHPIMSGVHPVNTLCRVEGNTTDAWRCQHWEYDDFMASTPQELYQNLKKWKAELEAY